MNIKQVAYASIIGLLLFAGLVYLPNGGQNNAQAQTGDPRDINGAAWSSNVGWLDFDWDDDSAGAPKIDESGNFSGYAWNSNIGWIDLSPDTTNAPDTAGPAKVSGGESGAVTGWIRACSVFASGCSGTFKNDISLGGWDGWIKMSGGWSNGVSLSAPDETTGGQEFSGYSWGDLVLGWVLWDGDLDNDTGVITCCGGPTEGEDLEVTVQIVGIGEVENDFGEALCENTTGTDVITCVYTIEAGDSGLFEAIETDVDYPFNGWEGCDPVSSGVDCTLDNSDGTGGTKIIEVTFGDGGETINITFDYQNEIVGAIYTNCQQILCEETPYDALYYVDLINNSGFEVTLNNFRFNALYKDEGQQIVMYVVIDGVPYQVTSVGRLSGISDIIIPDTEAINITLRFADRPSEHSDTSISFTASGNGQTVNFSRIAGEDPIEVRYIDLKQSEQGGLE